MNSLYKILSYIKQGGDRSIKAKKNIVEMLLIQGLNMLLGLLIVPITLGYVDSETYGVWLTLSSMVLWVRMLDIGINNGLRNKLAEAFAHNNINLAREYVSTTYAILSLIFIPTMLLLLIGTFIVDWNNLLNIHTFGNNEIKYSVCVIIIYFCLNFILSTINIILQADQRPSNAALRNLIQQIVSVIVIYILTRTTDGSLLLLCIGLCLSPLLVILAFNLTLFRGKYQSVSPSFSKINFSLSKSLLGLGVKFFIIQIGFIVQYQLANFLILRYCCADDVTSYNIAYKYFNVPYSIFLTVLSPLWVACTDAMVKNDLDWIWNAIKKYTYIFMGFLVLLVFMLCASDLAYDLWVGNKVTVTFVTSLFVMLYNVVILFGSIYINVLNGVSVLKVQTLSSIISPTIFLLVFFLGIKGGLGLISVPVAGICSSINGLIFAPLQCYFIFGLRRKGNGIFYK